MNFQTAIEHLLSNDYLILENEVKYKIRDGVLFEAHPKSNVWHNSDISFNDFMELCPRLKLYDLPPNKIVKSVLNEQEEWNHR